MNKKEVKDHAEMKARLDKIVQEVHERHLKKRGITEQLMVDIKKFALDFNAFGN